MCVESTSPEGRSVLLRGDDVVFVFWIYSRWTVTMKSISITAVAFVKVIKPYLLDVLGSCRHIYNKLHLKQVFCPASIQTLFGYVFVEWSYTPRQVERMIYGLIGCYQG